MVLAAFAHRYAFSDREFMLMNSARLPLASAAKDAAGLNDLLLEIRHTMRGTNFVHYDSLLEEGTEYASRPLLGDLTSSRRYAKGTNSLQFDDVDPTDEEYYVEARKLPDGDYGYRVISPQQYQ